MNSNINQEVIAKLKLIEIHTKRILSGVKSGDFFSKVRGTGFEFEQLRDYVQSDDVRFIDWKSSAKLGRTMVKSFYEDKERSIIVALDSSASMNYGFKKEISRLAATALYHTAYFNKYSFGFINFSNKTNVKLPLKSSKMHLIKTLDSIYQDFSATGNCSFKELMNEIMHTFKSGKILVVISDFINCDYEILKNYTKFHDIIFFNIRESFENNLPNLGFIKMKDIETNQVAMIDARNFKVKYVNSYLNSKNTELEKICKNSSIDLLNINTLNEAIDKIIKFFLLRAK